MLFNGENIMSKTDRYRNKYFSVLGDSISTFEGYSHPKEAAYYDRTHKIQSGVLTVLQTWWGQTIQCLGGELLVNNSISGSTVCRTPLHEIPSYGCSDWRTSSLHEGEILPNVIVVFLGINDWGSGLRVFPQPAASDNDNLKIFSVAYGKMLEKLKNNYPKTEIWCLTLPISRCSSQPDFQFSPCYAGRHIEEYCAAICENAKRYGCRIIDLYNSGQPHDTIDGFHPNADGMKTLADSVIACLQKE